MFKIKAPETFAASLTIRGQGREQKLDVVFNHLSRKAYSELLEAVSDGKKTIEDAVLELLKSWKADAELSKETLAELDDQQPGALWAIVHGYSDALRVERKGN